MIYRRGKYYWVKFRWKGALIRKSTRAEDPETACKVEKRIRARLALKHAKTVRLETIRGTALEALERDWRSLSARRRTAAGSRPKVFPRKESAKRDADFMRSIGIKTEEN